MTIATNDIAALQKNLSTILYRFNGKRYMFGFSTFEDVKELLNTIQFYRANRQCIINIDALQTVKPVENSKHIIRLKDPNHKFEIEMSSERRLTLKNGSTQKKHSI